MECRGILVTTQWETAGKIRYLVKVGGSESLCRITFLLPKPHTVAKAQRGWSNLPITYRAKKLWLRRPEARAKGSKPYYHHGAWSCRDFEERIYRTQRGSDHTSRLQASSGWIQDIIKTSPPAWSYLGIVPRPFIP